MKWTFILIAGLAGCSGGGDTEVVVDRQAEFDDLYASVVGDLITPFSLIPDSGSYLYSGQMQLNVPLGSAPKEPYFGEFDMTIAISDMSAGITGGVDGFTSVDGDTLGGRLAFSEGTLLPDADPDRYYLLTAEIDGQLTSDGVEYDLSGNVAADLYGIEADGIAGVVFGDIIEGDNVDIFDGKFAGREDP